MALFAFSSICATACAPIGSKDAVCDATDAQRTAHAAALAADGGDKSVVTGQALIATLDATCK